MPYCSNCEYPNANHDEAWCLSHLAKPAVRLVTPVVTHVVEKAVIVTAKVTPVTSEVTQHCPGCRCRKVSNAEKQRAYRERKGNSPKGFATEGGDAYGEKEGKEA